MKRPMIVKRVRAIASDLSARRVAEALGRRVRDVPHLFAWHVPGDATRRNRERLEAFRNRHAGGRCVVIGNGPSLGRMDLSRVAREVTFGTNRIYLLAEKLGFLPTYFVCVNELVLEQFAADIARLPMPKFLNWDRRALFDAHDPTLAFVRLRMSLGDPFANSPTRPLSSGGTVTYAALQLAFFMGFREVILVGVDHNFVDKGTPNRTEVRQAECDDNHFHPQYFPTGSRWQLPDLLRSELAYAEARSAFERAGGRIVDATVGGKCKVFEKVELEKVL